MSRLWRHQVPVPEPDPAPVSGLSQVHALLAGLGAAEFGPLYGYHVYFLLDGAGAVFYVGSSKGIACRMRDHLYLYGRRVYQVFAVECRDEKHMLDLETTMIKHLQPTENKTGNDANLQSRGRGGSRRREAV